MSTPDFVNSPSELWYRAHSEHPTDAEARSVRYRELMYDFGFIVDRERPRCQTTDNFYGCTLDEGHDGDHESRSGCISAHRWPREPGV